MTTANEGAHMDKQERERLRALATEATPGPWRCAGSPDSPCPVVSSHHRALGYQLHTMLDVKRQDPEVWRHMKGTYQRDAQYIAAANPEAVLRLLDALDAAEQRAERAERRYRFLAPIIEYRREADTREMQIACALAEGVELDKAIDDAMAIEEAEQKAERQAAKRRAGCPECRGKGWVLHPDPEARTMEPCGCTIDGDQPPEGSAHG